METTLILVICSFIGLLLLIFGSINVAMGSYDKIKFNLGLTVIGGVILLFALPFTLPQYEDKNDKLISQVAAKLDIEKDQIILEDLAESSLFGPTKNANLITVYVENEAYLVEVENNTIKKVIKE